MSDETVETSTIYTLSPVKKGKQDFFLMSIKQSEHRNRHDRYFKICDVIYYSIKTSFI